MSHDRYFERKLFNKKHALSCAKDNDGMERKMFHGGANGRKRERDSKGKRYKTMVGIGKIEDCQSQIAN